MGKPIKHRLGRLLRNPVSLTGLIIAGLSTLLGLPMMIIDFFVSQTNPYTSIFVYLIFPSLAALGVFVAVIGLMWERRRLRLRPDAPLMPLPRLDLNIKRHRIILAGMTGGLVVLIFLLTITGYRAYKFSDSVVFCGVTCHEVMKPEYTAYLHSPHARVACVECHIGPGVNWFVKSKITGAYQVYSVLFDKFSRPIETPIKDLRPAQETCEQCHWPAKFFGSQQKTFTHYLTNTESNEPWQIQMLIKIGGGDPALGEASGIHWHMNIKNKIEFVSADERGSVIPWVRSTDPDGNVTEYISEENTLSEADLARRPVRRMDCIDCHNRPSHIFHPPGRAVDAALWAGLMDPTLPFLKREAVRLLSAEYATEPKALDAIAKGLPKFYRDTYPAVYREKSAEINKSIQALQTIFSRNIFPEMKTDWRAHLNHISHVTSDGCFRCHAGLHKSRDGNKVITADCNACHTILGQGPPSKVAKATLQAQPFIHPVDLGFDVTSMKCTACHTGTSPL